jgi:predicted amidohydrolase
MRGDPSVTLFPQDDNRYMKITVLQPQLSRTDHHANLHTVSTLVADVTADLMLLPELFYRPGNVEAYRTYIAALAHQTGACIVGGSTIDAANRNYGVVMAPDGSCLTEYSKRHPYGPEVEQGVTRGTGPQCFTWQGVTCAACICADVWDARLVWECPSAVQHYCVVAQSVAEEHTMSNAQHLWRSLAVARAYERASVISMSDWAAATHPDGVATTGAAGLVDPSAMPVALAAVGDAAQVRSYDIDFAQIDRHREARRSRHFLLGHE